MREDKKIKANRTRRSGITMLTRRALAAVIALVFVLPGPGGLLGPVVARAEGTTYTWKGPEEGGYWHTAGNWVVGEAQVPEQAPGSGDTVIIPEQSVVECVYGATGITLQCAGDLTVSSGALLGLTGDCALTGGKIHGDGNIEILGTGSKLSWTGGTIGDNPDTGSLIVGEGVQLLIEKTGQAVLNLSVENKGYLSISKNVTRVCMQKGYTQTSTGTLSFDISEGGEGSAVFGQISIKQETSLELAGELHVNLVDGYMPAGGTTLKVLVYTVTVTRSGAFNTITSSEISRSFTAVYTDLEVTLTAQEVTTAAPTPSLYPGTYGGGAISVALSSYTEGADIYYTTDGVTDPTVDSIVYTGPIAIDATMTIKAFAVKDGLPNSPVETFDYVIKNDFAGGYGTEENPYEVATAEQLYNVRYYPNDCFEQIADIDLNVEPHNADVGWLPIVGNYVEDEYNPFCGIYDGQGHTISNLYIRRIAQDYENDEDAGLFGYVDGAVIRNVKLMDVNVTGDSYVGSLVGYARDSRIENCSASGQVQGTGYCIGGLIGCSDVYEVYERSQITDSYSTCIVFGETYVGGLVGGNTGQIISSYAQGRVTGTGTGELGTCAGGLVGENYRGTVESCYATGSVEGEAYVGGLIGLNYKGAVTCSYAMGNVTGTGMSIGGLVGYNAGTIDCAYSMGRVTSTLDCGGLVGGEDSEGSTAKSYWDNETSGQASSAGGTGKTTTDMKDRETYVEWDFTDTWDINAGKNSGYPLLRGVTVEEPEVPSDPPADDEPFWLCRSPKPTPHMFSEVKYVNGKFMAVGNNGTILSSADGENWNSLDLGTKDCFQGIAYDNGKYVAVGYYAEGENVAHGVIYASSDGENWTLVFTLPKQKLADITYGNGKFVAVGNGDNVVTSSDGLKWNTKSINDVSLSLNSITYANGVYMAVGGYYGQGHIVTSTDGENWVKQTSVDARLEDVAFGNGKFIAVTASDASPGIYASLNNGEDWTKQTASGRLYTVDYDGSRFIAAGSNSWGSSLYLLTSIDGTTWTGGDVQLDAFFWAVASGDGKYVGVGGIGSIATSTDGTYWTRVTSGTLNDLFDVAYNGHMFVSVGQSGTIQTSPDGIAWTVRNSGTTEGLRSVEWLGGRFIAVGNRGVILTSADGETWTKQTGINTTLYDVAYGNGLYIIVGGETYPATSGAILASPDGIQWTSVEHDYKIAFVTVTYGNGKFIALGQNGQVYVSTDGAQWPRTYLPGGGIYPQDIIYADGRFVATGGYGEIYTSDDDGTTWTVKEKVNGIEHYVRSVAYGGGNLVVVTEHGKILISFDKGDTWEQQISGFENQRHLYGVAAGSSNFVAVGQLGLTLQSTDFGIPGNPDADAVDADKDALTWDTIRGGNSLQDSVTSNLVNPLPVSGASGTTISWSANPTGWVNTTTGAVTRPSSSQGNKTVTLTATISKGAISQTKDFPLTIVALPSTGSGGIAPTYYTISAVAGPGGIISPESAAVAAYGSQTFTITPDSGYQIADVLVDGKSIGPKTTYTFEKVTGKHMISATFRRIFPFKDVKETDWFYNSVKYAFENGLMTGTATDYFSPVLDTSRAMIVTILHRLEKTPDAPANIFTDVDTGTWYTGAVAWAAANGIVKGYGGGLFGPADSVTREQLACILYNYARYAGYDVSQSAELTGFIDGGSTSDWALEAMKWAVGSGLIQGKGNGLLDPTGPATRAEVAAILERFIEGNTK